ncbi:MAG: CHAD domain-containing protein [Betaproteobacteria bacterium]|nr:CHAD domain-containing protein [Betaproteobacteria bacterium]
MTVFDKNATPYQAFHAVLWDCAYRLDTHTALLQAGVCDQHRVHQARVALRRLRTARKAFAPLADERGWHPFTERLQKLAASLGQIRDLDVLGNTLLARISKEQATPLADACARARSRRCRLLTRLLKSPHGTRLLPSFFDALRLPLPETPPPVSLRAFADQSLHRLHERVLKLATHKGNMRQLHALRKRIKELRYSAEFFSALYLRKSVQDYLNQLQMAQDALGQVIDGHASLQQLGVLAREFPGIAPLLPSLNGLLEDDLLKARSLLNPALKAVKHAQPFWRD